MRHIKNGMLERYLSEDLNEIEQDEIEDHIEICESCFDQYLQLLDNQQIDMVLSDDFTDQTIGKIYQQNPSQATTQTSSYQTKKAVINYLLAASLTLVLMLTGVFQNFLTITDVADKQEKHSITEQLIDKTNGILDRMKGEYK